MQMIAALFAYLLSFLVIAPQEVSAFHTGFVWTRPDLSQYRQTTSSPSPSPSPSPVTSPQPSTSTTIPATNQTKQSFIMSAINAFRVSKGLSTVQTDSYTCSFAAIRAKEISSGFNHDGFTSRLNSKTLPYPSYKQVTENLARTSDFKRVVSMWINSPGHAANMLKDTPYVCVGSYGDFYAYEGWKP